MKIKASSFNKISFCPVCFSRGTHANNAEFVFYDHKDNCYCTEKFTSWKEHADFRIITKGFTPHILRAEYVYHKGDLIYSMNCSVCEIRIENSVYGPIHLFLHENNGKTSVKKWNELVEHSF